MGSRKAATEAVPLNVMTLPETEKLTPPIEPLVLPETVSTSCPPTKSVTVTVAPVRLALSTSARSRFGKASTVVDGGPAPSLKVAWWPCCRRAAGDEVDHRRVVDRVTATDEPMASAVMLSLAPRRAGVAQRVRVTTRVAAPGSSLCCHRRGRRR